MKTSSSRPSLDQFLFDLPRKDLSREERVQQIKEALQSQDPVEQEQDLDRLLARLLESIQSET